MSLAELRETSADAAQSKAYGCLFCTTGKEMIVARMVQETCPDVRAVAARQEKHKTLQGQKSRIESVFLPGYVFFEAPEDMGSVAWLRMTHVIRVLSQDGIWQLAGEDERFARWLFRYDGLIGFSKAHREGERIRILSGPLKDMEGKIIKVDKRGRSGQVAIEFNQRIIKTWLGFELVDGDALDCSALQD